MPRPQARVLSRFHFALIDTGYLFLGRAETLMAQGHMFVPVDMKRRISRKRSRVSPREAFRVGPGVVGNGEAMEIHAHLRAAALEVSPLAQVVLDAEGRVVSINERARSLFSLHNNDVGRPLRDLQLSYRPVELRSVIDRVELDRHTVGVKDVEWRTQAGEIRWLDLTVTPVMIGDDQVQGMLVTFTDMTAFRRLQRELEQSHMELETAYEELQSTNEELETMNEELQSTNEELETINDEVRQRSDDLNQANRFLGSVLTSLQSGVAVVDRELRLLAWNRKAEELWGLRGAEVSRGASAEPRHRPPGPAPPARPQGLPERPEPVRADAPRGVNRRGRKIACQVTCTPLLGREASVAGAILLMEEIDDARPSDRAGS